MNENSRTAKALRNSVVTMACELINLILIFICRTIFTRMLGAEYLGVSGLFTNILTILSFAEMGIGSALVYRMYAPLASGDKDKVRQYMLLYRRIYTVIIGIIVVLGLTLIPFLGCLVEAPDVMEDITLLFCLFLLDTVISYVLVYKKSLLIADQNDYIVSMFTQAFNILMNIMQCVLLVLTHNFVLYCITRSACNLLNNIVCSWYASRKYPFLQEPTQGKLSKEEIKGLKTDVKGLMLTKVASTAFSGTDNLFISVFIGIRYVGILSNYTLILSAINSVMNKIFNSVTASIGNLAVSGDKKQTEIVLKRMFFLNTSLYGYLCLGMLLLIKEFVTSIWLSAEYELPQMLVTLVVIELFLRSIHYPLYTTRNAMGFFSQYRILFMAAAFLNLILDYMLVKPLGMSGLFFATILCRGITYMVDIYTVYHIGFGKSIANYMWLLFKWFVFLAVCGSGASLLLQLIPWIGILGFVLKIVAITVIYVLMYLLVFARCEEFCYFKHLLGKLRHRKGGVAK